MVKTLDLGSVETNQNIHFKGTLLQGNRCGGSTLDVSDAVREHLVDKFQKVVGSYEDSFLAEAIMRLVRRKGDITFESIPKLLEISDEEAAKAIKYLNENNALWVKNFRFDENSVRLVNDADPYLSSPEGVFAYENLPYRWITADTDLVTCLLTSVADLTNIDYFKKFEVSRNQAKSLEGRWEKQIKKLQEKEKIAFGQIIELPANMEILRWPSFISQERPFGSDEDPKTGEVLVKMNSSAKGFTEAYAYPNDFCGEQFPVALEIKTFGGSYTATLQPITLMNIEKPLAYQRNGKEQLDNIVERLKPWIVD